MWHQRLVSHRVLSKFVEKIQSNHIFPSLAHVTCTRHLHSNQNRGENSNKNPSKPKPLPRLIYFSNPIKHCWAKFNMKMLKLTWDPEFCEKEFEKGACRVRIFLLNLKFTHKTCKSFLFSKNVHCIHFGAFSKHFQFSKNLNIFFVNFPFFRTIYEQAVLKMTELVRKGDILTMQTVTTRKGFEQISKDSLLSMDDPRLNLLRFREEDIKKIHPLSVHFVERNGNLRRFFDASTPFI